ncbi:MAG TPA: ATP-binding cassette domain-containing protein [Rhodobacteraceae bacterium]|nr:ATP-binding cassette domain-containing protein [Paracoccaceae bacterium]
MTEPILSVKDMKVWFDVRDDDAGGIFPKTKKLKAVDGVSFDLMPGETLGIVGESGCGKSTLARAIIRLVKATSGEAFWMGRDLLAMSNSDMLAVRKDIQMIFQDPLASLNPRMTCGEIIAEPLKTHFKGMRRAERREKVWAMLEKVGMDPTHINRYPHEFSGGQCQRIGIARALITNPKLIICDEPVSALDVSVQAQVVNLLMALQKELGISLLFIAHDLSVVKHISDRIMVLYFGNVVEIGTSKQVIEAPEHAYTQKLIASIPIPDPRKEMERRKVRRAKRAAS